MSMSIKKLILLVTKKVVVRRGLVFAIKVKCVRLVKVVRLIKKKGSFIPHFPLLKKRRKINYALYMPWRQGVLRACSYKCFITGSISTPSNRLECHHLIGWWYQPGRYDIKNGVSLSRSLHIQFHNLYGRGNNLTIQFEEFCKTHYNITYFPWRHGNYKPRFTFKQEQQLLVDFAKKKEDAFKALVTGRNHTLISGTYLTNSSILTFYCTQHNHTQRISVRNYKSNKTGLTCCASDKIIESNIKRGKKPKLTQDQKVIAKFTKNQERVAPLKKEFQVLVHKRKHTIISGAYLNCRSTFVLFCALHNHEQCISVRNYKNNRAGLKCCASEETRKNAIKSNIKRDCVFEEFKLTQNQQIIAAKKQESVAIFRKRKTEEFMALVEHRKHTVISGDYINCYSTFVLFCALHNYTQNIIVTNYKNNKTGLKCCASDRCGSNSRPIKTQ